MICGSVAHATEPSNTYERAKRLVSDGAYLKGIDCLTSAIADGNGNADIYALRGSCYQCLGYLKEAAGDYTTSLFLKPDNEFVILNFSDLYLRAGNPKKALKTVRSVRLNSSNKVIRLGNEALALSALGDYKSAIELYQRATTPWSEAINFDRRNALDIQLKMADLHELTGNHRRAQVCRDLAKKSISIQQTIRIKSHADTTRKYFSDSLRTEYLTIFSQGKSAYGAKLAKHLERVISFINSSYCKIPRDFHVTILIAKNRSNYELVAKILGEHHLEEASGVYFSATNTILIHKESSYGTITHELIHAIFQKNLQWFDPWANEGIPAFFEKIYGFSNFEIGFQNPWRLNKMNYDFTNLNLKRLAYDRVVFSSNFENEDRLIAMFLAQQKKLKPYLNLAQAGRRGKYPTMIECAFELPIEKIEPLWKRYLQGVSSRIEYIKRVPDSEFFSDEITFQKFWKKNREVLLQSR